MIVLVWRFVSHLFSDITWRQLLFLLLWGSPPPPFFFFKG